ncbi:MAG: hypothetical protein JWO98_4718 [Frankiales bacterium]|nr:hypothetical protein [Frankiales bacterium]
MNVTDGDRERARGIVANWSVNFGPDDLDPLRAMIETYLADERERARAPFLRLAASFDNEATDAAPEWPYVLPVQAIADRIRRAAEEQQ